MSKHRKAQPVTRREVLRIVQRARDEILSAIVHANAPHEYRNGRHLADVEPVER